MDPQSQDAPSSEPVAAFFEKHRTGLVALVFTDLVDSTVLLSQLGDQAGASFLRKRREIIRDTLRNLPESEEIETAAPSAAGDGSAAMLVNVGDVLAVAKLVNRCVPSPSGPIEAAAPVEWSIRMSSDDAPSWNAANSSPVVSAKSIG